MNLVSKFKQFNYRLLRDIRNKFHRFKKILLFLFC